MTLTTKQMWGIAVAILLFLVIIIATATFHTGIQEWIIDKLDINVVLGD